MVVTSLCRAQGGEVGMPKPVTSGKFTSSSIISLDFSARIFIRFEVGKQNYR